MTYPSHRDHPPSATPSPRRWLLAAGGALLLVGGLAACGQAPSDPDAAAATASDATTDPSVAPPPTVAATPSPSPSRTPRPSASPTAPPDEDAAVQAARPRGDDAPVIVQGRVDRVIDGDTFELSNGTRVRLAITDTPEIHNGVQTCGPEAASFATDFLAGQTVAVYRPTSAPTTDTYRRTLGEAVRVSDGASLNVALVAAGLGRIDDRFTAEDADLTDRLRTAAASADTPTCGDHSEPGPAPEPAPATGGSGQHGGRTDGGWACHPAYHECLPEVGDLNCGDVGHSVTVRDPSDDPYGLDGNDHDGAGCESKGSWSPGATYPYY